MRRSHIAHFERDNYTVPVAVAVDYERLWARYLPMQLPTGNFLRFWIGSHRLLNVAEGAFKVVGKIYAEDPSKDATDLARLVSAQMKKIAIAQEERRR